MRAVSAAAAATTANEANTVAAVCWGGSAGKSVGDDETRRRNSKVFDVQ